MDCYFRLCLFSLYFMHFFTHVSLIKVPKYFNSTRDTWSAKSVNDGRCYL